LQSAWAEICAVTSRLAGDGIPAYSPIAHTHALCMHNPSLDPLDHSIWMPFDTPMMKAAAGLVVVTMDGWVTSHGISIEIKEFKQAGKPVFYLDPVTLEVT
jgi:hypothetical protein